MSDEAPDPRRDSVLNVLAEWLTSDDDIDPGFEGIWPERARVVDGQVVIQFGDQYDQKFQAVLRVVSIATVDSVFPSRRSMMPIASLSPADSGYALESPYDPALVAAIKSLPYNDRRWDNARKRWIIAHEKAPEICRLVEQHLGVVLQIPQAGPVAASELRVLRVEYVGRAKAREDGTSNASGYLGPNERTLVFPESVLRTWFLDDLDDTQTPAAGTGKRPRTPDGPLTLYRILAIKPAATADEVKKAYRQLARQWHPDVCKEPDANEQFLRVKHAYDVLGDDKSRRKYDAGLTLEASLTTTKQDPFRPYGRPKNMQVNRHDDEALGYRSPLRCGLIVAEGTSRVGQFLVSKILKWDDIIDSMGRTMVSSWPSYGDIYEIAWWI